MMVLFLVFALGCIVLMGFGLISLAKQQGKKMDILKRGIETQGTITAIERDYRHRHYCYPIVRFKTARGWFTLRANTSILRENLQVGQQVPVRYPDAAPEDFIVISGLDYLL